MDIAGRGLRMIVHRFSRRYCGCYLPRVLPARALCVATQLPHCRVPYSSCPLIDFCYRRHLIRFGRFRQRTHQQQKADRKRRQRKRGGSQGGTRQRQWLSDITTITTEMTFSPSLARSMASYMTMGWKDEKNWWSKVTTIETAIYPIPILLMALQIVIGIPLPLKIEKSPKFFSMLQLVFVTSIPLFYFAILVS